MSKKSGLGRIGVWSGRLQRMPSADAINAVHTWEELGYSAVWIPESPSSREVLTAAAVLLGATSRIVVATGIAVIWNRTPAAMMNAGRTLAEAHPGRFVLGIGVSHRATAEALGHSYDKPVEAMRSYIRAMDGAAFTGPPPEQKALRVVGALGPRMTALGGEMADGIHTYLTTPEHTEVVREALGPDPVIAVSQAVVMGPGADALRTVARTNLSRYLGMNNYRRHLLRRGAGASSRRRDRVD